MVKEVPDLPGARPRPHVAHAARAPDLEPAARRRQALSAAPRRPRGRRHALMEALLQQFDTLLLVRLRRARRWRAPSLMLVLQHPMRVALALVATMLSLARRLRPARRALHRGVPGADLRRRGDGVHGVRDHAARRARPLVHAALLAACWCRAPSRAVVFFARARARVLAHRRRAAGDDRRAGFGIAAVLRRTSSRRLLAALRARRRCCWSRPSSPRSPWSKVDQRRPWISCSCCSLLALALFALGLLGVIDPPQRARDADVHGADAERRQPEPRDASRSRPTRRPARCSCSWSSSSRRPRSPSRSRSCCCSCGAGTRSTSTRTRT